MLKGERGSRATGAHSPVDAVVAHDHVGGPQARAQLRGHGQQAHPGRGAGGVLAGGRAAAVDEALQQTVQLVHRVQGTHQL